MPLPTAFNLSLDLSNIIGPIAKSALRLGSMTVLHEINKSGSDGITELQLSALIGRYRIAQCIKENF
ncbi:hypothetical protein N7530_006018 [Penicillium desertorum]|uniref:Uncharacterized protein n=1 Tax=Penicillium desertorum TaxID=1303715 RepID=A0A9W9X194_9EURO|nr:hypothetical protein N7530_006018 [Penicillium desertorum]